MKLKVGDKVRIKEDLEFGIYTSSDRECVMDFIDDMMRFRGTITTINDIDDVGHIKLESNGWNWVDTMLQKVESDF